MRASGYISWTASTETEIAGKSWISSGTDEIAGPVGETKSGTSSAIKGWLGSWHSCLGEQETGAARVDVVTSNISKLVFS